MNPHPAAYKAAALPFELRQQRLSSKAPERRFGAFKKRRTCIRCHGGLVNQNSPGAVGLGHPLASGRDEKAKSAPKVGAAAWTGAVGGDPGSMPGRSAETLSRAPPQTNENGSSEAFSPAKRLQTHRNGSSTAGSRQDGVRHRLAARPRHGSWSPDQRPPLLGAAVPAPPPEANTHRQPPATLGCPNAASTWNGAAPRATRSSPLGDPNVP